MTYYVNPEGQRMRKSGAVGATYFAYGPGGALLAENVNGAWVDYVWLNGRLIGRIANGQTYAIHADQTGRPETVTDASRTVVWQAQNLAFTRNVTKANITLNMGFPGQYYDAETDKWNNGFRDYDARLGRYVESDPIGLMGGVNTYTYVDGNPLSYVDPFGLWQVTITADLGLGGLLTFGYNSGQFNIGGYVGVGLGASVSANPDDAGCHEAGSWRGTRGDARLGAGVLSANVSATVGPGVSDGEVTVGTPINNLALGVAVSNGQYSQRPFAGNVTVGESAFLGYGGQMYFGH